MLFKHKVDVKRSRSLQRIFLVAHAMLVGLFIIVGGFSLPVLIPTIMVLLGSLFMFLVLARSPGSPKEREKIVGYLIALIGYAMLVRNINLGLITAKFLPLDDFALIMLVILNVLCFLAWTHYRELVHNAFDLVIEVTGIGVIFASNDQKRFFYPLSSLMGVTFKDIRTANLSLTKIITLTVMNEDDSVKTLSLNLAYVDKDPRRQEGILRQVEQTVGIGSRPS